MPTRPEPCSRLCHRWVRMAALLALFLTSVVGQTAQMLGDLTFSSVPALTLDGSHLGRARARPATISAAATSFMFVSSVGGIAFGSIARPEPGLKVVSLRYNGDRLDGQRLEVTLAVAEGQERTIVANVCDWQLVPIARFADGETFACFTLFGRLQDEVQERALSAQGAKILNYHSAFENTLLGLRLLQADILILYPDCADLILEEGKPVLGRGESPPDIGANRRRLMRVQSSLSGMSGGSFDSYLICDHEQEVVFSDANGVLSLTGSPLWHCWRRRIDDPNGLRQVQDEANRRANRILNSDPLMGRLSREEREQRFDRLWDEYVTPRLLEAMPPYSRQLSAEIRNQEGANPPVYNALLATMRYAAFFRYIKKDQPPAWNRFLDSIRDVKLDPSPLTPTVMRFPPTYWSH